MLPCSQFPYLHLLKTELAATREYVQSFRHTDSVLQRSTEIYSIQPEYPRKQEQNLKIWQYKLPTITSTHDLLRSKNLNNSRTTQNNSTSI